MVRREAPSTIRCIETIETEAVIVMETVGKHPAPSGALRLCNKVPRSQRETGREAPSTIRCIETDFFDVFLPPLSNVGKHPAPSGALRPLPNLLPVFLESVGKHPAPSGALRPCSKC